MTYFWPIFAVIALFVLILGVAEIADAIRAQTKVLRDRDVRR